MKKYFNLYQNYIIIELFRTYSNYRIAYHDFRVFSKVLNDVLIAESGCVP